MKTLVRTLSLSNYNYGGILQAWALQRALGRIGIEATTDISVRVKPTPKSIAAGSALALRPFLPATWNLLPRDRHRLAGAQLERFINEEMTTTRVFTPWSYTPTAKVIDKFDCFVAGSDQVWRHGYGDPFSYMFDFLPPEDTRPRIAYAASFGSIDAAQWSSYDRRRAKRALEHFDRVTCREKAGVEWCCEAFGIEATWAPDPTVLIDQSEYGDLIRRRGGTDSKNHIFAYILDSEPWKAKLVDTITETHRANLITVSPNEQVIRPSLTEWLDLIRSSDRVVTDSFHGAMLSIVFGKPVTIAVNSQRGASRFDVFAEDFGIGNCMVSEETFSNAATSVAASSKFELPDECTSRLGELRSDGMRILKETFSPE